MALLVLALVLLLAGGCAALLAGDSARWATRAGVGGAVMGGVVGLVPAVAVLLGGAVPSLRLPWAVPFGSLSVELDPLGAFFLLPLLGVSALAALSGGAALLPEGARRRLGPHWFFFDLLVASMTVVVLARNAVLFLVAWEIMALASFFLVTFDDGEERIRDAGRVYLIATRLGTLCLLVLFLLLGRAAGSLDFDRLGAGGPAGLLFLLALIGFGTKSGFVPLHVWLPEAHPAAPPHVSAVMSGVMTKLGIYGLVRLLMVLGPLPGWCGWTLVAIGSGSAVLGILSALAQTDAKRLLAYSSIENLGLIALGLGLFLAGRAAGVPALAVLALAGALLHVLNHALMKGLLFLGTGAVVHGAGTRSLERLGGLLGVMPRTGAAWLVGAAAIAGLPPLGGFASEFLLGLAAFHGVVLGSGTTVAGALVAIAVLGLVAGLAAACFTRAFGIAFLGVARSDGARRAHEPGRGVRAPIMTLAVACILAGAAAPWILGVLERVLTTASGLPEPAVRTALAGGTASLAAAVRGGLALVLVAIALAASRRALLARRRVAAAVTWDCGYLAPGPRMQYTASSFAQPLTSLFGAVVRTRRRESLPRGLFPASGSFATETADPWRTGLYHPLFAGMGRGVIVLRRLQHGEVQLYVLYIALTLLVLLLWKLG